MRVQCSTIPRLGKCPSSQTHPLPGQVHANLLLPGFGSSFVAKTAGFPQGSILPWRLGIELKTPFPRLEIGVAMDKTLPMRYEESGVYKF